jgi:hypothetical protein
MPFPANPVVANGARLLIAQVPDGEVTPPPSVISVEAAALANAQTVSLSADVSITLPDDYILQFSPTKSARIRLASGDTVTIGTTASNVAVFPLATALADTDTVTAYPYRELLGITDLSPPMQPQTVDSTDMRSGFGQSNVVVGVNRTLTVTGNRILGDRCHAEIIMPYLTDDVEIQKFLYAKAFLANGDVMEGLVRITDGGATGQVRTLQTYNYTLTFQGNAFSYSNPREAALLA